MQRFLLNIMKGDSMCRLIYLFIICSLIPTMNLWSNEGQYKIISYEYVNIYFGIQSPYYEILNAVTGDTVFKSKTAISLFPEKMIKFINNDTLIEIRMKWINYGESGISIEVSFYDLSQKPTRNIGNINLENSMFACGAISENSSDFTIILSRKIPQTEIEWSTDKVNDKMRCIKISIPQLKIIRDYYVDSQNN